MVRFLWVLLLSLAAAGCATKPVVERPDPVGSLLEPDERVMLRISAQLLHGHDMKEKEPSYDLLEDDRQIPTYQGELALTNRRLLFVEQPADTASWLSIPYEAVARSRPSQTSLLHYLVVWDNDGHPDSFIVDSRSVRTLHWHFGQAMAKRTRGGHPVSSHAIIGKD